MGHQNQRCSFRELCVSFSERMCDTMSLLETLKTMGTWNGNGNGIPASCAGLAKFPGRKPGQNFQRNVRTASIGSKGYQGSPVRRWDASQAPAAHCGRGLPQRISDRASASESRYD